MKINVAQQLKGRIGESRAYLVNETSSDGYPIEGEARLVLTNRSILVTGQFSTLVRCTCSRCLEEFDYGLVFALEEEFFPSGNILIQGREREEEDRDEGFYIGEDHMLDLSEAFRQNILVNLPRKPICYQQCAGICAECGRNLNRSYCQCHVERTDSRWGPLGKILVQQLVKNGKEVG